MSDFYYAKLPYALSFTAFFVDCLLALQTGRQLPDGRCRNVETGAQPTTKSVAQVNNGVEFRSHHEPNGYSEMAAAAPSVDGRLQDHQLVHQQGQQQQPPQTPRNLVRRFADYYDVEHQYDATMRDEAETSGDLNRLLQSDFGQKYDGRESTVKGTPWSNRPKRKRGPAVDPTFLMMGIGRK